jgi:hypothetical protein
MLDVFLHIPKTSGSSLRTVLSRQYGVGHIAYFEPGNPQLKGQDSVGALKSELEAREIRLVTGHHAFGLHASIGRPVRYFSVIRDPISRAASDYFYAYSYEHHRLRTEILSGALTPEAFLIEGRNAAPFDTQCRLLSGRSNRGQDTVEQALETVELCFAAIGVAELFDESLILIAKRLGWNPPLYATRNVTRLPAEIAAKRRRCEDRVRTQFADRYAADLALHDEIKAKLRREIEDEGTQFSNALSAFREMQAVIERANPAGRYDRYEFAATDSLPDLASSLKGSYPFRTLEDYLRSPTTPIRPRNYVGHVDVVEGRAVGGWAADLASDRPIEVRVYRSGRQIGGAIAGGDRPDVTSALGIRGQVGFNAHLGEDISISKSDVYVCFEGSRIRI